MNQERMNQELDELIAAVRTGGPIDASVADRLSAAIEMLRMRSAAFRFEPGDVLFLKSARPISNAMSGRISEIMGSHLPGVKVIVLEEPLDIVSRPLPSGMERSQA